ncbi:protein of unknown function DUF2012 [Phytophthora cactorum]|nr:protein of unknown function DUF2012 [Phytophthora cactorum]
MHRRSCSRICDDGLTSRNDDDNVAVGAGSAALGVIHAGLRDQRHCVPSRLRDREGGPLKVQLNGGEQTTFVRADGSFVFRDLEPARYVVDIPSTQFLFSQYKVDVAADGLIRALEYKYPGAPKMRADYPLIVEPVKQLDYFEQRGKFNLLGLIMNPSFLTIVCPSGCCIFCPSCRREWVRACVAWGRSISSLDTDLSCCLYRPGRDEESAGGDGSHRPVVTAGGMLGGGQTNADDSDDD